MFFHRFFDKYQLFYESSRIGTNPNRLEARHIAMIQQNAHLIKGKRVLDIASHDGRWTLAALEAGAEYVVGIEFNADTAENARQNLSTLSYENWNFVNGDAHKIRHLGRFDLVMCFGFFYHTIQHYELLSEISAISDILILDTKVSTKPGSIMEIRLEPTGPGSGVNDGLGSEQTKLSGFLTTAALDLYLKRFNYQYKYVDWEPIIDELGDDGIHDYVNKERVTLVAERI